MWHIGPREIPLPHGASDELRDSIAATPLPDLSPEAVLPADVVALKAVEGIERFCQTGVQERMLARRSLLG